MRIAQVLLALVVLGAVLLAGCSPQPAEEATPAPAPTIAPLVGEVTRAAVEGHPGWEELRAQDYVPDPAAVAAIRERAAGVEVLLFLGTWCGDSQREVPRFFRIMDEAEWDNAALTIHALDYSKKDAAGLTETWGVAYVPTFILLQDGRELGRIVESPQGTLEGDIARILGAG